MTTYPYLPTIHPWSRESVGAGMAALGTGTRLADLGSSAWPTANTAHFVPFLLPAPTLITKMWVANGTAVSGNLDMGIYDHTGRRLIAAGSTAHSGVSAIQSVDITDAVLGPGLFYMAITFDNTAAILQMVAVTNIRYYSLVGIKQMASAFPLPETATYATMAQTLVAFFGLLVGPRTVI